MFDRRWRKGIKVRVSMCDPTALLDLVPSEGLLKRPSMDYNEYTYCYGGGRGGWYFSSLLFSSSSSCSHRSFSPLGTSRCGRTCGIFFLSLLSLSLPILLWSADPSILRSSNEDETIFTAVKIGRDAIRADLWSRAGRNFIILLSPRLIGGSPVFLSNILFLRTVIRVVFHLLSFSFLFSVGEKIFLMEAQKRGIFLFSTKIDRPARKKRKKRRMRKETSEPSCSRRRCHATALSRLTYLSRWRFQIVTRRNFSRDENGRGYKIRKFRQTFSNMCMITGMENTIPR